MSADTREPEKLHCPSCRAKVHTRKSLDWTPDHGIKCKNCGQVNELASWRSPPKPRVTFAAKQLKTKLPGRERVSRLFVNLIRLAGAALLKVADVLSHQRTKEIGATILCAIILLFVSLGFDSGGIAFAGILIYITCRVALRQQSSAVKYSAAISIALISSIGLRAITPRTERWSSDSTTYVDYYRGLTGTHYYRELSSKELLGGGFSSEGPMTATGKPHGEWKTTTWGDHFRSIETHNEWHWYGESITEGEWHLRNK